MTVRQRRADAVQEEFIERVQCIECHRQVHDDNKTGFAIPTTTDVTIFQAGWFYVSAKQSEDDFDLDAENEDDIDDDFLEKYKPSSLAVACTYLNQSSVYDLLTHINVRKPSLLTFTNMFHISPDECGIRGFDNVQTPSTTTTDNEYPSMFGAAAMLAPIHLRLSLKAFDRTFSNELTYPLGVLTGFLPGGVT